MVGWLICDVSGTGSARYAELRGGAEQIKEVIVRKVKEGYDE